MHGRLRPSHSQEEFNESTLQHSPRDEAGFILPCVPWITAQREEGGFIPAQRLTRWPTHDEEEASSVSMESTIQPRESGQDRATAREQSLPGTLNVSAEAQALVELPYRDYEVIEVGHVLMCQQKVCFMCEFTECRCAQLYDQYWDDVDRDYAEYKDGL